MSDDFENQTTNEFVEPNESDTKGTSSHSTSTNEMQEGIERCRVCGSTSIEEGYSVDLCSNCRDMLSKRRIPLPIKITALIFTIVIIISLIKFPSTLKAGIEYERGLKAENSLKYATALKHFKNVNKTYPDSDKVLVKLMSAYYHNNKIDLAYDTFDKIAGPNPEKKKMNSDLVAEVNRLTKIMDSCYAPSNELYKKLEGMQNADPKERLKAVKEIVDKNPNEAFGAYYLANAYFEMEQYDEANKVITAAVLKNPSFNLGLLLQAATFRELCQYDKAVKAAESVLASNSENVDALVSLSKIELKRKNNAKGLDYAKQAYDLDNSSGSALATLSLAYHFNGKTEERDQCLEQYKSYTDADEYTLDFLTSIFNGNLQWQQ